MAADGDYGPALLAEYEAQPAAVKLAVTLREYAWMDPEQRIRILDDLCLPDVEED